jgi:uncharacterized membrane protein
VSTILDRYLAITISQMAINDSEQGMKDAATKIFLFIIMGSSVLLVVDALFIGSPFRVVLGILFVSLYPGFALFAASTTSNETYSGLETLIFSIGGSILIVSCVAFVIAFTPWGFRVDSMSIALGFINLVLCSVGILRKKHTGMRSDVSKAGLQTSFLLGDPSTGWLARTLYWTSLLFVVGIMIYALITHAPRESFTEFYFSDLQETRLGEQMRGRVPFVVPVHIANHEDRDMLYILRVSAIVESGQSIDLLEDQVFVGNNSIISKNIHLNNMPAGTTLMRFDLFVSGQSDPDRTLSLDVGER